MHPIFLKALQDNNQDVIKLFVNYMAAVVRDEMEDFHVKHLSDAQMKELNPLIRNGIYNAMFALNNYQKDAFSKVYVNDYLRKIPDYWEDPVLSPPFDKLAEQLSSGDIEISFQSDFLNKEFKLGNISFNIVKRCIEIAPSYSFKEVTGDNHRHRDKINSQLRKEGYQYVDGLYGYVKRDFDNPLKDFLS